MKHNGDTTQKGYTGCRRRPPAGTLNLGKEDLKMPIFLMFGRYSSEAIKGISSERTDKARELIEDNDGKIISMYAVMGEHDLVFTIDFPGPDNAMAASVALYHLTGIHFSTSPVVDVEQFDKLMGRVKDM
jgi:uncharacterized protein with GYD domain